ACSTTQPYFNATVIATKQGQKSTKAAVQRLRVSTRQLTDKGGHFTKLCKVDFGNRARKGALTDRVDAVLSSYTRNHHWHPVKRIDVLCVPAVNI
ncbi:hypothetical protein TSMEX_004778, partial [Taenia solium]